MDLSVSFLQTHLVCVRFFVGITVVSSCQDNLPGLVSHQGVVWFVSTSRVSCLVQLSPYRERPSRGICHIRGWWQNHFLTIPTCHRGHCQQSGGRLYKDSQVDLCHVQLPHKIYLHTWNVIFVISSQLVPGLIFFRNLFVQTPYLTLMQPYKNNPLQESMWLFFSEDDSSTANCQFHHVSKVVSPDKLQLEWIINN